MQIYINKEQATEIANVVDQHNFTDIRQSLRDIRDFVKENALKKHESADFTGVAKNIRDSIKLINNYSKSEDLFIYKSSE